MVYVAKLLFWVPVILYVLLLLLIYRSRLTKKKLYLLIPIALMAYFFFKVYRISFEGNFLNLQANYMGFIMSGLLFCVIGFYLLKETD